MFDAKQHAALAIVLSCAWWRSIGVVAGVDQVPVHCATCCVPDEESQPSDHAITQAMTFTTPNAPDSLSDHDSGSVPRLRLQRAYGPHGDARWRSAVTLAVQ